MGTRAALLAFILASGIAAAPAKEVANMFATPPSIRAEHHELHEILERATNETGELGATARALRDVLEPHFKREEEIATPPLALLEPLSRGPATAEMRAVLPMTTALERELEAMLAEHVRIRAAVERFDAAARFANRAEYVEFGQALAAHARLEEEVLYPAAVLVGRYVAREAPRP
jgi:hypothetical protein